MSAPRALLALAGSLALFAACQPKAPPAPADESAAAADAIRAADAAWEKAFSGHDTTAAVAAVEATGSVMAPNAPIATGPEAIRAAFNGFYALPKMTIHWTALTAEAARSGELGYTRGTYELNYEDAKGKPVSDKGKYATVWRKQGDGSWKVVLDIFNSDSPMPGM